MLLSHTERERERQSQQNASSNSRNARSKSMTSESDLARSRALEREREREREHEYYGEQELKRDFDRKSKRRFRNPEPDSDYSHEWDTLNEEFKYDIVRLQNSLCSMRFVEKSVATEWISKLKADQPNIQEARARNQILSHLLKCYNDNIFSREPFNKPPPPTTLSDIKSTMKLTDNTSCMTSSISNNQGKRKYLTELYNDSYDNGDFLSQLPVPRDGAFFVLHLRPI